MGAQIRQHRAGFVFADVGGEAGFVETRQGIEIGDACAKRWIALPQLLAFCALGVGECKVADAERHVPAIDIRQRRLEADHRRVGDALAHHFIERMDAALAGTVVIGESDRRWIQLGRSRAVAVALKSVADRALLAEDHRAAGRDPAARPAPWESG